ncbi:MAG: type I-E CRISPR-associated protein Cas7/Cse4/CasC [Chloroflexi bacterium]|nr:type I-E CRISPR-associated protein Cas7/Cse4/CasC [Chloroflexota bacterium]
MFVEVHILQSFVPSNLNRDDTGSPKDCEFGGTRRARISSQCLKRAIRRNPVFAATTGQPLADRTRQLSAAIQERITELGDHELVTRVADNIALGWIDGRVEPKSRGLNKGRLLKLDDRRRIPAQLYVSKAELATMAELIREHWSALVGEKAQAAKARSRVIATILKQYPVTTGAPDLALFGRMMASRPELGRNAACQVAHALSTHRVAMELDFYTSVDDLQPTEELGASMMGVTGYDSACYYRYARIDWEQLLTNLEGDLELALKTVEAFIRASHEAVPTGKQNSSAAYNPPSVVGVVVRKGGMAWNLANAFEQAVRSEGGSGYLAPSALALDAYYGKLCEVYGSGQIVGAGWLNVLPTDTELAHLDAERLGSVDALCELARQALQKEG